MTSAFVYSSKEHDATLKLNFVPMKIFLKLHTKYLILHYAVLSCIYLI